MHSLRIKFIVIFLLAIVVFSSVFYFLWLPGYFQMENTRYIHETKGKFNLLKLSVELSFNNHQKYDNSDKSLFNQIISSQIDLYDDWIEITVYTNKGKIYYQKRKQNNDTLEIFRDNIFSFGEFVGVIELKVAPEIYARAEETHIKELSLVVIGLLIIILSIILLIQEFIIRKPLAQLTSASKAIMQGKFNFKLPTSTRGEIGELTTAFFQMKASLIETRVKLKDEVMLAKDIAAEFYRSEEQLSTIIQNISDGLVIVNDKNFIELYNPAFYKMLGYSDDELKGKNIGSIICYKNLKEHDLPNSTVKITESANRGIQEVFAKAKDGQMIPVEITVNDYIVNQVHQSVALFRDVTERKEAQIKLKAEHDKAQLYLDMAQVTIFSLDQNGQIILANKKAFDIFGFSKAELLHKNWFDLIPDKETRETLKDIYFLQMRQQDEIPYFFFLTMMNKAHEHRTLEWHIKTLTDKNSIPVGVIISGMDVTENNRIQIEKNQLRKQLLQSQKMEAIGQLTGGIAHDFNNILAGMMGYTELLIERENPKPDKRKLEYLDLIYESGERASMLIQNMLIYSRGISAVKKQSLYLPGMIKDVKKMLSSIIASSVKIKSVFDQNVPDIACDSLSIQQVIMNLCINARDAMNNQGTISLLVANVKHIDSVCTSCGERFKGDFVTLCVRDTGVGINQKNLPHLFEPFFSTKEVGKGSGMGLSVIHGILHEVGAHIVVQSEIDKGTSFISYFPLTEVIQDAQIA